MIFESGMLYVGKVKFLVPWRGVLLKRRPKNEDLRPLGLKRRPLGLKRRPLGLKRRPHGLKRRPHGLKRRPLGLKRLMLTAEGNARSRNLLRRFGNVVEFPLQYLVVIVKSITYLSFRFLCGKYFACFKPLFAELRRESPRGQVVIPSRWNKGPRFESRRLCVFFLVFFLLFLLLLLFFLSQLS